MLVAAVLVTAVSTLGGCSLFKLSGRRTGSEPGSASGSPSPPTAAPSGVGTGIAAGTVAVPGFKVVRSFPTDQEVDVPLDSGLILEFDVDVDRESLAGAVHLDPPLETGGTWVSYGSQRAYAYRPRSPLNPYTKYRWTVGQGLKDTGGRALSGAFSISFRTRPATDPAYLSPAWSPDGRYLAYYQVGSKNGRELFVVDATSADTKTLLRGSGVLTDGPPAWLDNGTLAAVVKRQVVGGRTVELGVYAIPLAQAPFKLLVDGANLGNPITVALHPSPDRKTLAIEAGYGTADSHSDAMQALYLVDRDGSDLRPVEGRRQTQRFLGWDEAGDDLFFLDTHGSLNNSHRFGYDLWSADLRGEAALQATGPDGGAFLTDVGGVTWYSGRAGSGLPGGLVWTWKAVDTANHILHQPEAVYDVTQTRPAAGGTAAAERNSWSATRLDFGGPARDLALSADGQRIAYAVNLATGDWEIWARPAPDADVAGGPSTPARLTTRASEDLSPAWSPDGAWLAFTSSGTSAAGVWVVGADGHGLRQLVGP